MLISKVQKIGHSDLLACLVAVFCLAEVSQFCLDRYCLKCCYYCVSSEEHQLHCPPLPLMFYSQCFPLPFPSWVTCTVRILFLVIIIIIIIIITIGKMARKILTCSPFLTRSLSICFSINFAVKEDTPHFNN